MKFETWLKLVYVNSDIPLRGGQSKHQSKIREILKEIEDRNLDGLLATRFIDCTGDTEIVVYCRYLQYCVGILKDEGA